MDARVPPFVHTPVEKIQPLVDRTRRTFLAHKTKDVKYRLVQLRKLYWGLKDNEGALLEACRLDIGKQAFETFLTEINWVENDIVYTCNNLAGWAKDEKARDIPLTNLIVSPKIRNEPLGAVLVIGAYNFPVQLSLGPFIGAMAAGCTAILKPSEGAPNTAAVMQRIIEGHLDPAAYGVVQGAIPETTRLLEQKWDKIFYTGSAAVGTIIAKKAAETLTPVALELGGLNPAIISKNADARLAARRLLWGKVMNAGQVCLSHNYTLVDKEILPTFVEQLKLAMREFFPDGAKASPDYGRIASDRHFQRLKAMVDNSRGKIVVGGTMDAQERFIEPTVVLVQDIDDSMIKDESFGPLMPILAVDGLDEAIRTANAVQSTPLALYPFGNKAETTRILRETRSGGASVNDSYFHGSIPTLAFGGVGESGTGAYRGKASFDCFTHKRSVTSTPSWVESLIAIRYPPYAGKLSRMQRMNTLKPNFDRDGKASPGLVSYIMTLGGGSAQSAVARYVLAAAAAFGVKKLLDKRSKL
ncbi:MAG: hypothetical protein M1832_002586 [Thelocarpon impressellum]|nr:MAG: hypothetical protein M1832_002586 [Thelocarpon impressellum]